MRKILRKKKLRGNNAMQSDGYSSTLLPAILWPLKRNIKFKGRRKNPCVMEVGFFKQELYFIALS